MDGQKSPNNYSNPSAYTLRRGLTIIAIQFCRVIDVLYIIYINLLAYLTIIYLPQAQHVCDKYFLIGYLCKLT